MLFYFIIMICYISAFDIKKNAHSCSSCKWFIPDKKGLNDYGLCKMFKNKYGYEYNNKENVVYELANRCRNNENMCGRKGFLFEPIYNDELFANFEESNHDFFETEEYKTISELLEEYDYINNKCCGEVNESDELENIERDLMNILKRLKYYYDKFNR